MKKKRKTTSFVDEFAFEYGVMESIMIQYFQYWIKENKKKGLCLRDGLWWTYGSTKKIASRFCYLNEPKVKKLLKSLKDQGVLTSTNIYNERLKDRTLWYTFTDAKRFIFDEEDDGGL